jgi:hypothetical protein
VSLPTEGASARERGADNDYFDRFKGQYVPLDELLRWVDDNDFWSRSERALVLRAGKLHEWALSRAMDRNEVETVSKYADEGYVWRDGAAPHWCPEPLENPCTWSGDPYAPHGECF